MKPDTGMRQAWRWTAMASLPWSGGAGAVDVRVVCPAASPDNRLDVRIAAGEKNHDSPH